MLDSIKIQTTKVDISKPNSSAPAHQHGDEGDDEDLDAAFDDSIFDRTVYTGYSVTDIKIVQKIFKDLGAYKGEISGDYEDILDDVVDYQLDK